MCEQTEIADALMSLGRCITPAAFPGTDASGGHIESLTEAVMGVTEGLFAIAHAIDRLAETKEMP